MPEVVKPKKRAKSVDPEDEEQKKQKEVMKKYYRNRYSSFLQALTNKKIEEELMEQKIREKEERRVMKLREKVLGQS